MKRQQAFLGDKKFLKGGLHCHTTRSDGNLTPEETLTYAKEQGCNLVLFGHTHAPIVTNFRGITLINPGTLSYFASKKTYCTLEIDEYKINAKIEEIH